MHSSTTVHSVEPKQQEMVTMLRLAQLEGWIG
jgi:hypothetical protein